MDRIRIKGGRQLVGDIRISGSKNASLPLARQAAERQEADAAQRAATRRHHDHIQPLKQHGVEIDAAPGENGHAHGTTMTLQAKNSSTTAPYDIVRKMRASVLVLGPLLARARRGTGVVARWLRYRRSSGRPAHRRSQGDGRRRHRQRLHGGQGAQWLKGARYTFLKVARSALVYKPMMAAALAKGTTVLDNAAREPEITDLAWSTAGVGHAPANGDAYHRRGAPARQRCTTASFPIASRQAPASWPP